MATRAVIQKGWLNLVYETGSDGHHVYILDENKETCKGSEASLRFDSKTFLADDSGKIILPYNRSAKQAMAVMEYKGFADIVQITLPQTNLDFSFCLVFNEESLDCGKSTSFVIQPKVYANNRLLSLSIIKNLKIILTSVNVHGLKQVKVLDSVKTQESEDLVVDYMIPSKTTQIEIDVRATFLDQESQTDVVISKVRQIKLKDSSAKMFDLYLKQDTSGYKIRVLGRNGEPYPGQLVEVQFETTFVPLAESGAQIVAKTFTLQSDARGEISLGPLEDVWLIKAVLKTSGSADPISWEIRSEDRYINFPEKFDIIEGESLCVPALGSALTRTDYALIRTDASMTTIYEDKFAAIEKEDDLLYLTGLLEGTYVFFYNKFRSSKKVVVNVRKGKRWDVSPLYVVESKRVTRMVDQSNYLTYSGLKVTANEIEAKIICNDIDSVRVHAMAYNYFPINAARMAGELRDNCSTEQLEVYKLNQSYNSYFSEKELSDEFKYVLERKNRSTFIGNTLEKPSGLLKREFTKKSRVDSQGITSENSYSKIKTFGHLNGGDKSVSTASFQRTEPSQTLSVGPSYSFLASKDRITANAQVDADGKVSIDISKFKDCSTVVLIIEDRKNCLCEIVNIGAGETSLKDIRLEKSRDPNKVYLHQRLSHKLQKGNKLEIPDLRTTDMKIISSRGQFMDILKLLTNNCMLDDWDFVKHWELLTAEEKLKHYDKYISHELNLFIYFKDREFFDLVIKSYISNKNEKTIIDHFLLGHKQELEKYLEPVQAEKVNYFEQSLVLLALKDVKPLECKRLLEYQKLYLEALKKLEDQSINLNFDLILYSQQSTDKEEQKKPSGRTIGTTYDSSNGSNSAGQKSSLTPQQVSTIETILLSIPNKRKTAKAKEFMIKENQSSQQTYKAVGSTDEYIERQYFFKEEVLCCQLKFWVEFMEHILTSHKDTAQVEPFLSDSFLMACTNFEALAILAVVDLPSEGLEHESITDNSKYTLTAADNTIIFCKEIKERQDNRMDLDVIINQKLLRATGPQ